MKPFHLIPLLFLAACSTTPKLGLRPGQPQSSSAMADNSAVRHPEIIRAYHIGCYADPNDDLVMHEQHVVYRVEENTRWDFRPGAIGNDFILPRDAAFSPTPVNEAVLAEVNSQRLATAQITDQARRLAAALAQVQTTLQEARTNLQAAATMRTALADAWKRLDALESAQHQQSAASYQATNNPDDAMRP